MRGQKKREVALPSLRSFERWVTEFPVRENKTAMFIAVEVSTG
jgi:hypothetical protein